MHLVPTPLPTALTDLLTSAARVSSLVQPAFGLSPDQPSSCSAPPAEESSDSKHPNETTNCNDENNTESNKRKERAHKRAVRMQYDLNNAVSLLEQLRWVVDETGADRWGEIPLLEALKRAKGDRKTHDKWAQIPPERKALVQTREVAAVLGAGAVVFHCLEGALRELGRLYETEREIRRNKEMGVEERRDHDANVVRWLRHETRQEVWEMMRGLKDLGTAVWFVLTVLESPSDDDVVTSRRNLTAAVAEILGKDNALSRKVKEMYPEPEAGLPPEDAAPSVLTFNAALDGADVVCNYDVDDDSDSDSEAGPPTPSSSEFPFPDTALEGSLTTLADTALSDILIPVPEPEAQEPANTTNNAPEMEPTTPTGDGDSTTSEPAPILTPTSPSFRDSTSLKVVTVSPSGINISPLPSNLPTPSPSSQPSPDRAVLSADAIFQLPEVTDQFILDFFHRALHVSRFADLNSHSSSFTSPSDGTCSAHDPHRHDPSQRQKLQGLPHRQFRELCADVYDELVGRNVARRRQSQGGSAAQMTFVGPEGLSATRVDARKSLALLRDEQLSRVIGLVVGELERRCLAASMSSQDSQPSAGLRGKESDSSKGMARLSAVQDGRWSVEAVWGGADLADGVTVGV